MRKKVHLAGLTPGSQWPNTGTHEVLVAPAGQQTAGGLSTDQPEPIVEFGEGWAKVHFRRKVTDDDRANLLAAVHRSTPGAGR
ncbi:hypothetical protein [Bradyrhizobium sp. SZCCHNR1020]|uniref:hypothetical protein n=1 Tax=Bradyrhizobium sp. SZCCHNR1020 TaxID=3057343 RepID=UPI002915DF96|nr:hypothetical protein [Bradyrhizobium sp. SZCCHNR1020]